MDILSVTSVVVNGRILVLKRTMNATAERKYENSKNNSNKLQLSHAIAALNAATANVGIVFVIVVIVTAAGSVMRISAARYAFIVIVMIALLDVPYGIC